MERSSSQRNLRVERLSRTPYARPQQQQSQQSPSQSALRKSASQSPFASLKSLVSYVSSPFTRSSPLLPTQASEQDAAVAANVDQKSEDGSEDGWNGAPPAPMQGQDVFTLASAAGRTGDEFEDRAATWRAKGEKPGGRRQTARFQLEVAPVPTEYSPVTPAAPGHFNHLRASPSMPALPSNSLSIPSLSSSRRTLAIESTQSEASSSKLKRTRSPPTTNGSLPFRAPLPAFLPPSTPSSTPSSASSAALTAFLEAKKGQQMTAEDFRVIETLTHNMKTESHVGSPQGEEKVGGWAAGSYPTGIRHSQSLANLSTPAKSPGALLATPGPVFSVGLNLAPGGGGKSSPYRQRYLGPGMSPRRMFPQAKKAGLQPLIQFDEPSEEGESAKKKRKFIGVGEIDIDVDEQTPQSSPSSKAIEFSASPQAAAADLPASPLPKSNSKLSIPTHTPARPSPLSRSVSTSSPGNGDTPNKRQADIEAAGRKRAAQILKDLIDEEIGPLKPSSKAEPIIFNPYDKTSLNSAPGVPISSPSTAFAGSTPKKSAPQSRTPVKRTPTRGAAAKLEAHKEMMKGARPLTTVERIKGVQPIANGNKVPAGRDSVSEEPATPRTTTPSHADSADAAEIDEIMNDDGDLHAGSSSQSKSSEEETTAPQPSAASAKIPPAETFKPFDPPTVTFSSSPIPKPSAAPSFGSFTSKVGVSTTPRSTESDKPSFPVFSLPKPQKEEPEISRFSSAASSASTSKMNTTEIYLSAKDSALKVAKPALPFYTFTLPKPTTTGDSKIQAAMDAARKASLPTFVFTLTPASDQVAVSSAPSSAPAAAAGGSGAEWTCSLCMLKNPASATEQCTICETPKPASAPAPTKATTTFGSAPKASSADAGGEWTCDTCMLKNPPTATEKCTICEAAKPAKPKTAPTTSSSSNMFGSFGASSKPTSEAAGSKWTCDTCMLKNPASATEKCTICEAAKPASKSTSAVAAPNGSAGFGFGFGQRPAPSKSDGAGDAEWTCSLCMLKNPGSAKEKCTICEAKRP